jgi:predicted peptidase
VKGFTAYIGDLPTGLMELDYRYPVFMYVPTNYSADRTYPLLITIPDQGQSVEENIKYWTGWARRRSMIVLSVHNIWPEDVPYTADKWLLKIKEDLAKRYRIDGNRVFIAGTGDGAHYAAYLGTNYPREFSGGLLFNGSWTGKYSKLLQLRKNPIDQVPFMVVVPKDNQLMTIQVEQEALDLESKGYFVKLIQVNSNEDIGTDEFKEEILNELNENAEMWDRKSKKSGKSVKEKVSKWKDEFFKV